MSLTFKMKMKDMYAPLGNMHINKLRDITKIKNETINFARIGGNDEDSDEENSAEKQ